MGSDWSLEELMNSDRDLQKISNTIHDANYRLPAKRVEMPPVRFEFDQYRAFTDPFYVVLCWCDGGYVFSGLIRYGTEREWGYEPSESYYLLAPDELRAIANKIDELNRQLIKERTWLDRLFNM